MDFYPSSGNEETRIPVPETGFHHHGMVQADSYYAKGVMTAMEAYNNGGSYLTKVVMRETSRCSFLFSISPLFLIIWKFRRVGCDTWADIGQTEYA